jgi:flagellar M-ring protein FliF
MDWLRKLIAQISGLWGKWSLAQRVVLVGIGGAVIAGFAALVSVSSSPTMVPVFSAPIRDEAALDRIVARIDQEGISAVVNASGVVQVEDKKTAQRMRAILIREDLVPSGIDPWDIFDRERWTTTDFERNVNLQRAITRW